MNPSTMSVIICTRDRGAVIVSAVESVLGNNHPQFDLIVVDQSSDDSTALALAPFLADPRLTYMRTAIVGTSRGQNLAAARVRGELLAITDDDCVVPATWLNTLDSLFAASPKVAVIYCNVVPGEYDSAQGFVPAINFETQRVLCQLSELRRRMGMGAGMAIRRAHFENLAGFDESLGPGSRFRSGADVDFGIRTLIKGGHVLQTNATCVTHNGFRTWAEGRKLVNRSYFGIGAFCGKPLRRGYLGILHYIGNRVFVDAIRYTFSSVRRLKKPQGLRRLPMFLLGFMAGCLAAIDTCTLKYVDE